MSISHIKMTKENAEKKKKEAENKWYFTLSW